MRPGPTVEADAVTLLWFIIWVISDNVGDREPLQFDPVNIWAGFLLLAVAIDLSAAARPRSGKR